MLKTNPEKNPLKWQKFIEKWPECKWIWLYTTKVVELGLAKEFSKASIFQNYREWAWAEAVIEYPEPPKRPRHRCENNHHDGIGLPVEPIPAICEQDEDGFLHLSLTIQSSRSSMVTKVEFCPFCGFKSND